MNPQFWWYVSRASGMVAAVLLAVTVVWGLVASTRLLRRPGLPAWLADLHRGLGGLTVAFVALHLASLVADSTVHFAWADLFVPLASSWRRGPVAVGVVAFWGLMAVEATSLLRPRLSRRSWRRVHLLSYPVTLLAALHAATAGTDSANPIFKWVSITSIAAITVLVLIRIVRGTTGRRQGTSASSVRPRGARSTSKAARPSSPAMNASSSSAMPVTSSSMSESASASANRPKVTTPS